MQQVIITEEFDKRPAVTRPSLNIAEWILPTILDRGTDAQRERFAEPMLRGPSAGVSCSASRAPGRTWRRVEHPGAEGRRRLADQRPQDLTSSAHVAQFGAPCWRAPDPDAPKHRGISYFLIDMASPGLVISPIGQASGHADFNECFFTDVFVPDDMLVGEPGEGWDLAMGTVAVERTAIGNYVNLDRSAALRHLGRGRRAGPRRDRARTRQIEAHTTAIKAMVLRETLRLVEARTPVRRRASPSTRWCCCCVGPRPRRWA